MYYPLYNNPFYYPAGAYIPNICSYGYDINSHSINKNNTNNVNFRNISAERNDITYDENNSQNPISSLGDLFCVKEDRIEAFGISINIDDLIILIMLFFMLRENQIDYSIIIILALILFDQN